MKKKLLFLSVFFNITFILTMALSLIFPNKGEEKNWVSKINDKHKITLTKLNKYYELSIIMSTLNSFIPISEKDMKKILNDSSRKSMFLKNLENQILITEKAKEKKLINFKKIDDYSADLVNVLRYQLIIKEFVQKFIYPKIKISKKEVNKAYSKLISDGNQELKKYSVKEGKLIIENKLKNEKINLKISQYIEKLRLEARIIQNNRLLE